MGIILIVTKEPEDDAQGDLDRFNQKVKMAETTFEKDSVKAFYSFGDDEGDVIELVDTIIEQIGEERGKITPPEDPEGN